MTIYNKQQIVELLKKGGAKPKENFESIALVFHAVLVAAGFTSVTEQASTVVGFAPSIRGKPR